MKRSLCLFAYLPVVFCVVLTLALESKGQAPGDPTLTQGLKPYGTYRGGDIDVVSLDNGKLDLHIPLLSYPQRGALQMKFTVRYNNPGYSLYEKCIINKPCTYYVLANFSAPQLPFGVNVVPDFSDFFILPTGIYNPGTGTYAGIGAYPILYMPDGSSHGTGNLPGTSNYRSTDASGWMVSSSAEDFTPATVIAPDGIRYSITGAGYTSLVEDTNGNEITTNFSNSTPTGWADSLGRVIPVPPTGAGGVAGNIGNCPAGALPVQNAYAWVVPAPYGGNDTYTFCYVTLSMSVKVGGFVNQTTPYTNTPPMLQSIVLPNGQSYSFTYDGAADLTQITLPTGGTISYTQVMGQMCVSGGAFPQNYFTSIYTRTVNANDGKGPHQWTYTGSLGVEGATSTRALTDPAGNQEVHTLTGLNGTCRYYDTVTKKYQGTASPGNLLQTITTNYSYTPDPYAPSNPSYASSVVNVVPTSVTTTWANGKTTMLQKTYDSGFTYYYASSPALYGKVMSESNFDYGSGGAGPILRRTVNNYEAFTNSNYLNDNILDPLYSVTTYDSSANQCKGVANTYCAYSYFGYDEVGLQSSGISTQHNPSPPDGSYRGNQTSAHKWLNGSTVSQNPCNVSVSNGYVVSNKVFFDTGEVQQGTDPCGYATTFLYSSTYAGAFPTTITNALSQSTVNTYDFDAGLLLTSTDPNQQQTIYGYDSSRRLVSASYPDGGSTGYSYNDSIPSSVTITQAISSSLNLVKTAIVDGLGRLSQTQLVDPDCHSTTGLDYVNYGYGYNSSTTTTTGAYTTVSNPYCLTSDPTYGITTKNEDGLNRLASVVEADGSQVLTAYAGNCTTVTDEAGNARQSCVDGLGRMNSVLEDPGSSPHLNYQTTYVYDALGDLTGVTQNGCNGCSARVRNFYYDSLSHLTSAMNPESGTVSYSYDADSNLITKTAPSPNQSSTGTYTVATNYTYDTLNRLTGKSYTDSYPTQVYSTPAVSYGYDGVNLSCPTPVGYSGSSTAYGIGRRTAMCFNSGSKSWQYDQMGRITSENDRFIGLVPPYGPIVHTNIGSGTPTISTDNGYEYYLNGDLLDTYYPAPGIPAYEFSSGENAAGRVIQAGDEEGWNLWDATYTPDGQLATTYGRYPIISNTYNSRLQPVLMSVTNVTGSSSVLNLTYNFNLGNGTSGTDNGNVISVTNANDGIGAVNYTYDSLNRLTSAYTTNSSWGESYTTDAWGNLTNIAPYTGGTKTNSENLNCAPANTQNQLNTCFNYDAAGNLILSGTTTYTYDAENRLIATSGISYVYDADGQRIEKCTEGENAQGTPLPGTCASNATGTFYWRFLDGNPQAESDLGGNWTASYGVLRGQITSRVDLPSNVAHYYLHDRLRSTNVITDASGNIEQESDYYPYGGEIVITAGDPNHYKFTGKERDSESGLDNFEARYYGSSMGRFMTPDWAAKPITVPYATFGDPQTLNLYSYVENAPLNRIDPDGHLQYETADLQSGCGTNANSCQQQQGQEQTAQNTQDSTAPPPPPTPDPAGTRTDPKLNPQPDDSSTTSNSSSTRTPAKGPPDTTVDVGGGTDRKYGPDGRAVKDVDSGHDHGAGDPHAHDWDWSGAKPQRGPGRPLTPEEQKQVDAAKKALIIYFIVSEGSRILFPPRNFVPVP